MRPDLVIFLDGLNDLTNGATSATVYDRKTKTSDGSKVIVTPVGSHTHDYEVRIRDYLKNMEEATEFVVEHNKKILIILQPMLFERNHRTRTENMLVKSYVAYLGPESSFKKSYAQIKQGLQSIVETEDNAFFLDCSDIFADETATSFCDIWHFADSGHIILADGISKKLLRLLP